MEKSWACKPRPPALTLQEGEPRGGTLQPWVSKGNITGARTITSGVHGSGRPVGESHVSGSSPWCLRPAGPRSLGASLHISDVIS